MSGRLEILPVSVEDKALFAEFQRVAWKFNEKDPFWVPPILSEQRKVLDPKTGAFYEDGEARLFLARRDGEAVGRISAHLSYAHDRTYEDRTGFFGFFECEDSQETAHALFDTAAAWLRERGRVRIRGPLSFAIYDEVGCLVDGYDCLPALMQVQNPRYYPALIESWGFEKAADWHALKLDNPNYRGAVREDEKFQRKLALMRKQSDRIMRRSGLRLWFPKPKEAIQYLDEIHELFNSSWRDNWGHVDLSRKQVGHIFNEVKLLLREKLCIFIMDGEKVAGFLVVIPDINDTLQKANGRLTPVSIARLLWAAKFAPLRRLRNMLLGVHKDYQLKGLHDALIINCYLALYGIESIEYSDLSLIVESNQGMLKPLFQYGSYIRKTWRIYDRDI